jgi:hypothetical protein
MIHIRIGGDVNRDTKTYCGKKLEDLPRADGSVLYRHRDMTNCEVCLKKAENVATMRGELT